MQKLRKTEPRLARNAAGYYEARWSEHTGDRWVQKRFSFRTKARDAAKAALAGFREAEADADRAENSLTADDLIDQYLDNLDLARKSPGQKYNLAAVRRYFSDRIMSEITPDDIHQYTQFRRGKSRVSDGTIRRELGALTATINFAVRKKLLKQAEAPIIELPDGSEARPVYLRRGEAANLFDLSVKNIVGRTAYYRASLFICIALETAARKHAIETLTWDRVDLDKRMIDYRVPGRVTKKRRVPVPISQKLLSVLEGARQDAQTKYVLGNSGNVRKAYATFIATTPYPDIKPHDLRRTWATLAAARGVPMYQIAAVLGDTIATVEKHYAMHDPEYLKGAMEED